MFEETEETVASGPNKDNLRLWVAGLRSDRFPQGRRALTIRMPDGTLRHCCLGVACEVAMENGLEMWVSNTVTFSSGTLVRAYNKEYMVLPDAVVAWLGLQDNSDVCLRTRIGTDTDEDGDEFYQAAELNDAHGWDFGQIADAIERTFELQDEGQATDGQ